MEKNAGEAEFDGKGGTTMDSFQQEIPGLEYWQEINLREAGFNGKRGTTRTHFNGKFQQGINFIFQQEITDLQ